MHNLLKFETNSPRLSSRPSHQTSGEITFINMCKGFPAYRRQAPAVGMTDEDYFFSTLAPTTKDFILAIISLLPGFKSLTL